MRPRDLTPSQATLHFPLSRWHKECEGFVRDQDLISDDKLDLSPGCSGWVSSISRWKTGFNVKRKKVPISS